MFLSICQQFESPFRPIHTCCIKELQRIKKKNIRWNNLLQKPQLIKVVENSLMMGVSFKTRYGMAYLTQFSIPALLKPMINKMADEASAILLLICSHDVCVKVAYDWPTALCLCMCLCRPSFHLSELRHEHKHKHKKNVLVRFSCAYAYALCRPRFHLLTHVLVPMLMLMR